MKLYAIVEQNQNRNSGAISVPFCLDSYDEAMKKVKELALSLLPQKAPKGSNFPWLSAALDDLVDNERECRVEASSGNFVFSFSHVPSGIRFQETGGTNIQWTVREIGSIQLGKTSMADIADGYNYELVRTSVLYSLRDRYPGLDERPSLCRNSLTTWPVAPTKILEWAAMRTGVSTRRSGPWRMKSVRFARRNTELSTRGLPFLAGLTFRQTEKRQKFVLEPIVRCRPLTGGYKNHLFLLCIEYPQSHLRR